MGKVVGVGGVFLKAQDPKGLQTWYHEHLGVPLTYGMSIFEGPEAQGQTVFALFPNDTKKFGESEQRAMINFRVDDLDSLLESLAAAGTRIDPRPEDDTYGKFAWIWDPEGNRVELWEPLPE